MPLTRFLYICTCSYLLVILMVLGSIRIILTRFDVPIPGKPNTPFIHSQFHISIPFFVCQIFIANLDHTYTLMRSHSLANHSVTYYRRT
jgi:hypothetical protein